MTVKELVEHLGKYPDDLSLERISVIKIQLDTQIHAWEGQHSDFYGSEKETTDDAEIVETLVFAAYPIDVNERKIVCFAQVLSSKCSSQTAYLQYAAIALVNESNGRYDNLTIPSGNAQ